MGLLDGLFGTKQGTTTTTNTSQPWEVQQPYLKNLFSNAQTTYNQNKTPDMGLFNQAQGMMGDTLSGKYLDPFSNPYFGGALNQTLGDVKSSINSNFTGDNFGSSAHQEWLGKGLMNAAMPMLAGQYNTERGNQMSAGASAPAFTTTGAQLPWTALQNYQQAVGGNYGGTSTQQQPFYQNNTANTVGTLLGGAQLGKMFGLF